MKLIDYPSYIDNKLLNYINEILRTTSDNEFDNNSFLEWLDMLNVESKNNPSAYIRTCFKVELAKGTYKPKPKVEYVPNIQPLLNDMREKGIYITSNESAYTYVLWNYLVNDKLVDVEVCRMLNKQILAYMKQGQSYEEYKNLLKKSNTLKPYNIDWELIEKRTNKQIEEWNAIMDEMGEII